MPIKRAFGEQFSVKTCRRRKRHHVISHRVQAAPDLKRTILVMAFDGGDPAVRGLYVCPRTPGPVPGDQPYGGLIAAILFVAAGGYLFAGRSERIIAGAADRILRDHRPRTGDTCRPSPARLRHGALPCAGRAPAVASSLSFQSRLPERAVPHRGAQRRRRHRDELHRVGGGITLMPMAQVLGLACTGNWARRSVVDGEAISALDRGVALADRATTTEIMRLEGSVLAQRGSRRQASTPQHHRQEATGPDNKELVEHRATTGPGTQARAPSPASPISTKPGIGDISAILLGAVR